MPNKPTKEPDMHQPHQDCPDCSRDDVSRRAFVKHTAAGLAASSLLGATGSAIAAKPAAAAKPTSETLVTQLYKTLTPAQKKVMAFKYDHSLRHEIENNWFITKARVGQSFNKDQQALIHDIFINLHSEEYIDKVIKQVDEDARGNGIKKSSIAIFGEPGTGKFEFVMTGRHFTRRCDGDSQEGTAFGGPIFYGHAAGSFNEKPHHPGNVYWYQAKRANEVFQMLDGKQRKAALCGSGRAEGGRFTVELKGDEKAKEIEGLPMTELSKDQRAHVMKVINDVLLPYREADRKETLKYIAAGDNFDKTRIAFYQKQDIGNDKVWDVWQIEGPHMISYFRGKPHVHAWLHVKQG